MSHCPADCGGALCGWAAAPGWAGIPGVKGMLWRQLSPQGMIAVSRHLDYHYAAASCFSILSKLSQRGGTTITVYSQHNACAGPKLWSLCSQCAANIQGQRCDCIVTAGLQSEACSPSPVCATLMCAPACCRLHMDQMSQQGGSISSRCSTRGTAQGHTQMADTLAITQGLRELPKGLPTMRGPGSLWLTAGRTGPIDKPLWPTKAPLCLHGATEQHQQVVSSVPMTSGAFLFKDA